MRGTSFDSTTVVSFDLVVSSCSLDVKGKEKEIYVVPVTILRKSMQRQSIGTGRTKLWQSFALTDLAHNFNLSPVLFDHYRV